MPPLYNERIVGLKNFTTQSGDGTLLTEAEVQQSFRKLFKGKDVNVETIEKAEELLDRLRPESPLRHRLGIELDELRELAPSD